MDAVSSKSSSASVTHFEDFADFGPHSPEHHERRPPLYNAEDYVTALKKFCKLTGLQMYLGDADSSSLGPFGSSSMSASAPGGGNANNAFVNHQNRKNKKLAGGSKAEDARNHANPTMSQDPTEMGLRQFGTVSELLAKLKADLNLSFPSFLREFISEPNDGVTLLLDLLKAVQLSQTNITGSLNQLGSRANHVMFKRALSDEFEALLCLKICARSEDGALKLVDHPSGLFTIAVCVMSNYSRSRILSLQLLSRLCDMAAGHKQVSDAISMLRLRFGEPVRFKFLVGMLNSYNSSMFQVACLRFLNRFVETSRDARERIMIQTELEEAGFDILPLKKFLLQTTNTRSSDYLREELNRWSNNYVDVNNLVRKLLEAERANKKLREDLNQLKEKHRGCEDDRSRSQSTVDRLRDCCDKLQTEIDRRVKRGSRSSPPGDRLNERQSSSSITANGVSKSKKSSRHSSKTRSIDESFGVPFKSQTTIPSSSTQSQMHSQDIRVRTDSVDGMDEADDEIDEVLLLLPTSNFDLDSQPTKERGKGPRYIHPSVNISDEAGSMVTVLATDGYTCITSPVPGPETQTLRSNQGSSNESQRPSQNAVGCSGDSGLSSDHSVKSASPEHHGSLKSSSSESDKSSLSEVGVTHDQLESEDDEDHLNEEIDVMYAERNVLQEEATTIESERISISRFRQRFCPSTNESTKSNKTNSSSDIKRPNHRSSSSVGSQFYPPNSTDKSTYQRHASNSLENRFNRRRHSEGIDSNEDPDEDIVPRRTSRPPMRSKSSVSAMQHRRPTSSPPQHKKYQPTIPTGFKTATETDRKQVDDTKREMIYLDDLTDGETSDGTHSLKEDEMDEAEEEETEGPAVELHKDGPIQDFMSSNTNTLETMSARSFGFVKPSPIQRENEFANRLRRHKSFFTPSTNDREGPKLWMGPQNPMAIANRKGLLPRRSESFHHSRSLGEFDSNITPGPRPFHPLEGTEGKKSMRGKSVDRFKDSNGSSTNTSKPLSKSKSMEFLKAKLLSRKASTKRNSTSPAPSSSSGGPSQLLRSADWDLRSSSPNNRSGFFSTNLGPKSVSQWGFGMQDSRHSPNGRSGGSDDGQQDYDWRQDTPFWNKKGRWARPSPTKKVVEEAWVSAQPSPTPPPLHIHPQNGGLGPIPAPPPLGTTNRVPMGWPGQFPHQGPLLGGHRKMGPFYPSFPVPGVNITHKNIFLPHGPVPFTSSYKSFVPAAQSSPAASFSGSSGSNKVKVNPLRSNLDMDLGPLSDEVNRLEITELSDEELLECPSPDYSTMHTGHVSSSTSPTHSVNTVIRKGGSGMPCDPQYPLHPHHLQQHQGSHSKKILDMPSGLY